MQKNRSGQFCYFTLTSAISGGPVAGASGSISGRKSLDGLSGMIVLSGNIVELGGGSYRANLYDYDTNGDQAGYLFTASGCVPVQYQFDMIDGGASGRVYLASGQPALVSGQAYPAPVILADNVSHAGFGASLVLSQLVVLNAAGHAVTLVASSGYHDVNLAGSQDIFGNLAGRVNSGTTWLASGSVVPPSGGLVGLLSGQAYLASGSLFLTSFTSGLLRAALPDYVLTRDYTAHSGHFASGLSGRCLLEASRKLINAWDLSASSGRLTVYAEDDVTVAYLQDVTSASGAAPITALNTD